MGKHSGPYQTGDPNLTVEEKLAQAAEIQVRVDAGESISSIARVMGTTRDTIYARLKLLEEGPRPVVRGRHWRDDVGYTMAHRRVYLAKGKAAEQQCRCGEPADQWAYNHEDPDEMVNEAGLPYSLNVDNYTAMCHSCHVRFDTWGRG